MTQLVVTHVSRALCPSHRLAFTTALCAAIAAEDDILKSDTWRLILDPSSLDQVRLWISFLLTYGISYRHVVALITCHDDCCYIL